MFSQRYGVLFPLAAIMACAGATTRVAQDDTNNDQPVSLSPTPEAAPDSQTGDTAANTVQQHPDTLARGTSTTAEGYAAYDNGSSLELKRIGQWTRTGIGEARRLIIRDANAWAEFWSELGTGGRPEVDFTRNVVVAVAAGQRPTGGYEIRVDQVRQVNGELRVEVVETTPGPNCMTTASLTQPVDVVVVQGVPPRSWSFAERRDVRGCR
jgi:protease stability complex PrcB-like protein